MNRERYQHIFVMLREEIKSTDSVEWFTFKQMRQDVEVMNANGMMSYIHEQMQDFYKEYLWKTFESQKPSNLTENDQKPSEKPSNLTEKDGEKQPTLSISDFPTMVTWNVYQAIKLNRKAKYSWLQDNLGVSESTILRAINDLKKLGYIDPEHSKVKGEWQLLK